MSTQKLEMTIKLLNQTVKTLTEEFNMVEEKQNKITDKNETLLNENNKLRKELDVIRSEYKSILMERDILKEEIESKEVELLQFQLKNIKLKEELDEVKKDKYRRDVAMEEEDVSYGHCGITLMDNNEQEDINEDDGEISVWVDSKYRSEMTKQLNIVKREGADPKSIINEFAMSFNYIAKYDIKQIGLNTHQNIFSGDLEITRDKKVVAYCKVKRYLGNKKALAKLLSEQIIAFIIS